MLLLLQFLYINVDEVLAINNTSYISIHLYVV
jgi:hypothetical protein